MKVPKILIIRTGSTYKELKTRIGDFDAWIKGRIESPGVHWKSINIDRLEPQEVQNFDGVIITGAHKSLVSPYPFLNGARSLLHEILENGILTLGICFGHQLLNLLLSGEVITNPVGTEMGVVKIHFTIEGLIHPLFAGLNPVKTEVYSSHSDIVSRLGEGVTVLAWNEVTQFQACSYSNHVFSVQFHPEYNKEIMQHYIRRNWALLEDDHLRNPGQLPAPRDLLARVKRLQKSDLILKNFLDMVKGLVRDQILK